MYSTCQPAHTTPVCAGKRWEEAAGGLDEGFQEARTHACFAFSQRRGGWTDPCPLRHAPSHVTFGAPSKGHVFFAVGTAQGFVGKGFATSLGVCGGRWGRGMKGGFVLAGPGGDLLPTICSLCSRVGSGRGRQGSRAGEEGQVSADRALGFQSSGESAGSAQPRASPCSLRCSLWPCSLPGVGGSLGHCVGACEAWFWVGCSGVQGTGVPHVAMARGLGLPGEAGPLPDTCSPLCRWLDGGGHRVPAASTSPKGPRASSPFRRLYLWNAHSGVKLLAERRRTYFI